MEVPTRERPVADLHQLCETVLAHRPLILASNRGPVEHQMTPDGRPEARRGSGSIVTALSGLAQNYAQLLLAAGREDEALEQFRVAARLNPYNYIAVANLGVKAFKDRKLRAAVVLFDRAIRVRADYAMGHKYLGLLRAELDQPEASIRHLERSLELDGRQPEAEKMRFLLEEMKKRASATG